MHRRYRQLVAILCRTAGKQCLSISAPRALTRLLPGRLVYRRRRRRGNRHDAWMSRLQTPRARASHLGCRCLLPGPGPEPSELNEWGRARCSSWAHETTVVDGARSCNDEVWIWQFISLGPLHCIWTRDDQNKQQDKKKKDRRPLVMDCDLNICLSS